MTRAAGAAAIVIICLGVATTHSEHASANGDGRTAQAQTSPAAAEQAILAAEDARLVLPADLHTPTIDALRARQLDDLRLLLELARSTDRSIALRAIRALGRLERRELIPELMRYLPSPAFTEETSFAIAQAFRGDPLPADSGEQIDSSLALLIQSGQIPGRAEDRPGPVGAVAIAVGRLPYTRADQVRRAQAYLLSMMHAADSDPLMRPALSSITRGVETLIRRQTRLWTRESDTIDELRGVVINRRREYPPQSRVNAMSALMSAQGGVDAETLRIAANVTTSALDDVLMQLRRLAAAVLAGAGSPVAPSERTELLTALLADRATIVRIEAIRAWARQEVPVNGCQRIYDALKDPSTPVVLTAIDLLPDFCKDDVNAVDRLTIEARTPPENEWHLASHALVALAKAGPKRVFIPLLGSHIQHQTWQVRMYAARAAAITDDVAALERLAYDREPNVREATLGPLRRLKGDEAEPYFVSAFGESDYQLLRTAANELKGARPTPQLAAGLLDALLRVTAERKDTSRDTRLALLDRLRELGEPDQSGALAPLLRDYDIEVARAAASLIQQWTGKPQEMDPQPLQRPPAAASSEVRPARVRLRSGKTFSITLRGDVAPLTVARFVKLATAGYYNGLSFHRVVPNFVVQGGSPGANEYSGDSLYMRDEISDVSNVRGAVGVSTRGRDTGDAQFFINLVDNPRLDFQYTVFGTAAPLDRIDEIVEGDTIASITFAKDDEEKNRADVGYAGAKRWRLPTDLALSLLTRPPIVSFEKARSSRSLRRSSISSSISSPGSPRWFRKTSCSRPCGPMSPSPTTP